jgi:WD40 repeat protein/tRNA A-37 threonylcarbamoyl transferase component Bud32
MPDADPLRRLARAVVEGSPVDWEGEAAAHPRLAPQLQQMRILQAVAAQGLLSLAEPAVDVSLPSRGATASLVPGFAYGAILGRRYRVVEVALKRLRREQSIGNRGRNLLRREVRSAREVVSPNVCRIFDLVEVDGQELVSMEYVDGVTLATIIKGRGPIEIQEAKTIAQQFLAGLAAIHQAGLVHRDVKPGNIMVTRTGRVVLMDFGLALPLAGVAAHSIVGTPPYMAPEQLRGEPLDARADIFAAGVVLAELVGSGEGIGRMSRKDLWAGIRENPPRLPDGPWRSVLLRAVASDRETRPASARTLIRALEQVTLRTTAEENVDPYPRLASFTERNSEDFFGREMEVEAMWRQLLRPPLHALIGPSGAGKTSFLRAGLLPARPDGWKCVICVPGSAPFVALAQALAPELAGDAEEVRQVVPFEDPDVAVGLIARWRRRHRGVLIIVGQFEELFTRCQPELQPRFADLLGRLAVEADARVLVSLRDDFLFHCSGQPALAPIFGNLMPLRAPRGGALRRALVQPALTRGCRFEDDALPDEMIRDVAEERGALPLLAFAVARLWELRERERGLLTREAYRGIGGVVGALARHAEATLDRIGAGRQALVREIFRNLVTSQGTRAARDREELLSVFPDRGPATEVLDALIDARLLTSFETTPDEEAGAPARRQVEIVHESLLTAWPRLVRWRTQDADGAQLRDQLRLAAGLWEERGRPADLLWMGSPYHDFQLWRERYPGGLTAIEEAFAQAMIANAERRRRFRRMSVAAAFMALLAVVGVIGWYGHREGQARLRAEASRLFAFGQLEIDRNPTLALAFAISSLGHADNPEVRRFAVDAMTRQPLFFEMQGSRIGTGFAFSPDGRWLAAGRFHTGEVLLYSSRGGPPARLQGPGDHVYEVEFGRGSDAFMSWASGSNLVTLWSVRERRAVRSLSYGSQSGRHDPLFLSADDREVLNASVEGPIKAIQYRIHLLRWSPGGGDPDVLGDMERVADLVVDAIGTRLGYLQDGSIYLRPVGRLERAAPRLVGRHPKAESFAMSADGGVLASGDREGEIRVWSANRADGVPIAVFNATEAVLRLRLDRSGARLASGHRGGTARIWDLRAPPGTPPIELRGRNDAIVPEFHPGGRLVATWGNDGGVTLWPLSRRRPRILYRDREGGIMNRGVAFAPDESWVASRTGLASLTKWPLTHAGGKPMEIKLPGTVAALVAHPDGRRLLAGMDTGVAIVPLDGRPTRKLAGFDSWVWAVAISPDGRYAAAGGGVWNVSNVERFIRVWSLADGTFRDLQTAEGVYSIRFLDDDRILFAAGGSSEPSSLYLWTITEDRLELLREDTYTITLDLSPDGRTVFHEERTTPSQPIVTRIFSLEDGGLRGGFRDAWECRHNRAGTLAVCCGVNNTVRIIPLDGRPAHDLIGHTGEVNEVAISPDDRWIVSTAYDGTVRLWPMPDGDPILPLARDRFLERLRALTNLRVVLDAGSPSGWKTGLDPPYPGWDQLAFIPGAGPGNFPDP